MENKSQSEVQKLMVHLTYEDRIHVKFMPEACESVLELGGIVKEVTAKYLIIQIECAEHKTKSVAIPTERILNLEKIIVHNVDAPEEEIPRVNFCEQPKISNQYIDTIQRNIKTTKGSYSNCGKWDALPVDVRKFLTNCAEYMLSLEIVAKEGIELKQSLAKARLEREGKTLYEKSSYVYAAYFRRHSHDEPEMGFVINEDVLLDASGKIVYNVYDCQTRDDLGAMTMYVPVSKEVSAADCPEYAVEVLQKLVEALKGKYYTAQSRQYNGDRPSGRMYGIGEAIDLLTDTADRIKKGEYHG